MTTPVTIEGKLREGLRLAGRYVPAADGRQGEDVIIAPEGSPARQARVWVSPERRQRR